MPLPILPKLPSSEAILTRIIKILAAGAKLDDPNDLKIFQALRNDPLLYVDGGLRQLAGELSEEFEDDCLLLSPDQLVAVDTAGSPVVVTVGDLFKVVRLGLIHCRLRRVIIACRAWPADTAIARSDKLRSPPLGFSDDELTSLAADLNQAMQADALALPPARVIERDPVTNQPVIETVQALCVLMLKFLP
jgi:hypothetical protein